MKGVLVMAPLLLLTTLCTVVVILLYSKYYEDERSVGADSRMVRQWRELAMRLYRSHDYRDAELISPPSESFLTDLLKGNLQ